MNKKWYRNSFIIVAALVFFFPLGLIWMWALASWSKGVKIVITVLFVLIMVAGFKGMASQPSTPTTATPTPKPTTKVEVKPVVEKVKVEVTSVIVKKVDKKYRYFFDIRNNDTKDFEGSVTISLYNNEYKTPLGKRTFETQRPIKPGLGDTVYFDASTGPVRVHGDLGIVKFTYQVKIGNDEVNSGEGAISEKFENLDF